MGLVRSVQSDSLIRNQLPGPWAETFSVSFMPSFPFTSSCWMRSFMLTCLLSLFPPVGQKEKKNQCQIAKSDEAEQLLGVRLWFIFCLSSFLCSGRRRRWRKERTDIWILPFIWRWSDQSTKLVPTRGWAECVCCKERKTGRKWGGWQLFSYSLEWTIHEADLHIK